MKREILFRGMRTDGKGWVEGFLKGYPTEDTCYILPQYDWEFDFEVIPETIGQFTGLIDVNGKMIFEGDILDIKEFENIAIMERSLSYEDREHLGLKNCKGDRKKDYQSQVYYDEGGFYVKQDDNCDVGLFIFFGNMVHSYSIYEIEVIGNIHDER